MRYDREKQIRNKLELSYLHMTVQWSNIAKLKIGYQLNIDIHVNHKIDKICTNEFEGQSLDLLTSI